MNSKHSPRKVTLAMIKGKPITTSVPVIHYHASDDEVEQIFPNTDEERTITPEFGCVSPIPVSRLSRDTANDSIHQTDGSQDRTDGRSVIAETILAEGTPPPSDPWKVFSEIKGKITKTFEEKFSEMKNEKKQKGRLTGENSSISDSEDLTEVTRGDENTTDATSKESAASIVRRRGNPARYVGFSRIKTGLKDKSPREDSVESGVEASEFSQDIMKEAASRPQKSSQTACTETSSNKGDDTIDDIDTSRHRSEICTPASVSGRLHLAAMFFQLANQLVRQVTYRSAIIFIAILGFYYLIPLSDCFVGFIFGISVTLALCGITSRLKKVLTTLPHEKSPPRTIIPVLEIPAAEEHAVVERFQGWVNELPYVYEPKNYHLARTKSVFLRLEGGILRIMETRTKIPKRAVWDEPRHKLKFTKRRVYDLTGADVELLPYGLARKRRWSKKYPISITLRKGALISSVSLKTSMNAERAFFHDQTRTAAVKKKTAKKRYVRESKETNDRKYEEKFKEEGKNKDDTTLRNIKGEGVLTRQGNHMDGNSNDDCTEDDNEAEEDEDEEEENDDGDDENVDEDDDDNNNNDVDDDDDVDYVEDEDDMVHAEVEEDGSENNNDVDEDGDKDDDDNNNDDLDSHEFYDVDDENFYEEEYEDDREEEAQAEIESKNLVKEHENKRRVWGSGKGKEGQEDKNMGESKISGRTEIKKNDGKERKVKDAKEVTIVEGVKRKKDKVEGKTTKKEGRTHRSKGSKNFRDCRKNGDGRNVDLKIFIFARADREKEDWYRRFVLAASRSVKNQHSFPVASITCTNQRIQQDIVIDSRVPTTNNSPENVSMLSYNAYMAKYLDVRSCTTSETIPSSGSIDDSHWINCLVARILFDVHKCPETINLIQDKIQRKLSNIKLPYFMGCLSVSEVSIGQGAPIVRNVTKPVTNERGLWLDLNLTYKGCLTMTVETKLNLMKLTRTGSVSSNATDVFGTERPQPTTRSPMFDSDVEDTPETSTEDEDNSRMHIDSTAKETSNVQSSGKKFLSMVDRIASNKYFQHATELSYVRRAMEGVSNTEIRLMVTVSGIEGCLSVNIPPAPSDRLWYGFKPVPKVALTVRPAVGERTVNIVYVTKWIEDKLLREFKKLVVLPNMDDLVLPLCPNYPFSTSR